MLWFSKELKVHDEAATQKQLLAELRGLRRRVAELEEGWLALKQAKSSLKEREERYRSLLQNAPALVYRMSLPDGAYEYVSDAATAITGFSPEELLIAPLLVRDRIHPEFAEYFTERWNRLLAGDMPAFYEYKFIHKSGEDRWLHQTNTLIRNQEGKIVALEGIVIDITERKQAEEALQENEAKYRRIIDTANEGIWSLDENFVTTFVNRRMAQMLGYDESEMIGRPVRWFLFEEDMANLREKMRDRRKGITDRYERRYRQKEGGSVWFIQSVTPLVDAKDGSFKGSFAMVTDITQRKQMEEALRRSEENYRHIVENAVEGIARSTPEGLLLSANPALAQMFGFESAEEMMQEVHDLGAQLYRDPKKRLRLLARLRDEGQVFGYEVEMRSRNGDTFWMSINVSCVRDHNGEVLNYDSFVTDITERKRMEQELRASEDKFRSLVETTSDCIWEMDSQGRYTYLSPGFQVQTGYPPAEFLGRTALDLPPEDDFAHDRDQFLSIEAGRQPFTSIEHHFRHRDGQLVIVEVSGVPLFSPDGEYRGMRGIGRDVTERKRVEELARQLEQQRQQVLKAESLNRMAGAIAHLFNNKLMAVMGNLELVLHQLQPESRVAAMLRGSLKAAEQAAEVSNHMLAYVGQASDKVAPLNLAEICCEVVDAQLPLVPKKITVETEIPDEKFTVIGNRAKVGQIITNLMTNAWESMGSREGSIRISVRLVGAAETAALHLFPVGWEPETDLYACLEVSDTGSGIPLESLDSVFDPFFSTKFTGRGLGLAVVLGTIRLLRGAVAVESEIDRGSTFRVFLPLEAQGMETAAQAVEEVSEPLGDLGVVLVVDDDPHVRNVAETMLRDLGCQVFTAKDGFDGVRLFQAHQDEIHCVLLDLTMPGMDGWETLVELRALHPDVPVILTSGYDEAQVMLGDHSERPQVFLHKPYHLKDLQAAMEAALNSC
jgi:two-component system, cell cycle sensor histidine kinase and response regulator CckA